MPRSNAALFWPVVAVVTLADFVTKFWADRSLTPFRGGGMEVMGDFVRFTLVYNPGAAFGLQVGNAGMSRWVFLGLTLVALGILAHLHATTRPGDRPRTLALALVCGGALGNLIDRVRWEKGVVDFIDVGLANGARWPTFNIADVAVSSGAFLLAWVLWDEDRETVPVAGPVGTGRPGELT
jgi:signal peptidase II